MPKLKLRLTEADHTALQAAANGKARMPKVDRQALFALMADHAKSLAANREAGVEIETR